MSKSINTTMGLKEWVMLLALSLLWGGSFFFVELVVKVLPPITIVFLRVALAAMALWGFVLVTKITIPKSPKVWLAFLVMGLLNNVVPFTLIVWGQTYIASGLASILNTTTPLFTVVIAGVLLTDERPTLLKLLGVAIGFVGAIVMIGPSALQGLGSDTLAQIAVLGAALSYGFAGVYGRRFKALNINPIITATGQVTASAVVLAPIALFVEQPLNLPFPSFQVVIAIFALAILSTAVAYILYFRILASAGATNLLLVTFLIPISAVFLGTLILGESLELIHFIGMGLITIGLSAIDGRLWRYIAKHLTQG